MAAFGEGAAAAAVARFFRKEEKRKRRKKPFNLVLSAQLAFRLENLFTMKWVMLLGSGGRGLEWSKQEHTAVSAMV